MERTQPYTQPTHMSEEFIDWITEQVFNLDNRTTMLRNLAVADRAIIIDYISSELIGWADKYLIQKRMQISFTSTLNAAEELVNIWETKFKKEIARMKS